MGEDAPCVLPTYVLPMLTAASGFCAAALSHPWEPEECLPQALVAALTDAEAAVLKLVQEPRWVMLGLGCQLNAQAKRSSLICLWLSELYWWCNCPGCSCQQPHCKQCMLMARATQLCLPKHCSHGLQQVTSKMGHSVCLNVC